MVYFFLEGVIFRDFTFEGVENLNFSLAELLSKNIRIASKIDVTVVALSPNVVIMEVKRDPSNRLRYEVARMITTSFCFSSTSKTYAFVSLSNVLAKDFPEFLFELGISLFLHLIIIQHLEGLVKLSLALPPPGLLVPGTH